VVSEEKWFQDKVKWIDFLKLRASWGLMGRDNIRAWLWTQLYERNAAKGAIFGTSGINSDVGYALIMPKAGVNSDVHWDKTYKTNFGIDAHFLRDRLTVDFNYYYDRGRELFATRTGTSQFPTTVGTQATPENYGELDAWGWELNLGWRDKIGKDFKYNIKLSTGFSDNKMLKTNFQAIPEYDDMVYGERTDRGLWGFKCLGMFRSYQDIEEYFAKNNITEYLGMTKSEVRPGMLIYEDIHGDNNGDGTYADKDGNTPCMPDGFEPDIKVDDDPLDGYELGDENETMLYTAINGKAPERSRSGLRKKASAPLEFQFERPTIAIKSKPFHK
jgi:hypothetical protein